MYRKRHVPSWLEGSGSGLPSKKCKQAITLPRTVIYVMSPKELRETALAVLEKEILLEDFQNDKSAKQGEVASFSLDDNVRAVEEVQRMQH